MKSFNALFSLLSKKKIGKQDTKIIIEFLN